MEQAIEKKPIKKVEKNKAHHVYIDVETKKTLSRLEKIVNRKKIGRKIKLTNIIAVALGKLTESDFQKLKDQSLKKHERKKLAFELFCKNVKAVSFDQFDDLMTFGKVPKEILTEVGLKAPEIEPR